jgi:hypothetical protein
MGDKQFRVIRGLLVTVVILLGLITGILLRWRGSTCEELTRCARQLCPCASRQPAKS